MKELFRTTNTSKRDWDPGYRTKDGLAFSQRARLASCLDRLVARYLRSKTAASYDGNLGFREMMVFYGVATPQEEAQMQKLLDRGDSRATQQAWALLQRVTGMKLRPLV